jgi:Mrp family chromosome partitioning ATPase
MGLMLEALKQIEAAVPPVILPLPNDECGMMNDECSADAAVAGTEQSVHHSSFSIHHSPVERFTFPKLPEPHEHSSAVESPKAIWPECNNTETAWACAETADKMLRQLSLEHPRVVAFTSPGDGDGKTNLLVALAPQLAKRIAGGILVVDANFRRPNLTARLSIGPDETAARPGLIYPTNLPRLSVLPAAHGWDGSCTATPEATVQQWPQRATPETSGFDRSWIEELRQGWTLVLLDMASLAHAEVAPLAQCCDGVYLVVRLGHTARRAVAEAARVIRGSGGRLLGCVVVG